MRSVGYLVYESSESMATKKDFDIPRHYTIQSISHNSAVSDYEWATDYLMPSSVVP